ncbi:hypothetical protein J7E26_16430 [Bacillus sp. ISL-51]|uniref:hypothetical protein n=1 Tax=Bacteria TaxID=2 RepID=UPI001BEA97C3|nr:MULTISPECIES: hypothetical protein [Bacteria]MBT2575510.1 hypothetical protein [Bacillus sp. ISL-51]MBT2635221.1 hypothetical protein [Bacillus sp. ISL-26]MBT2711404.1 hypothetical protein [Pseudomonas sp. ISL-88]
MSIIFIMMNLNVSVKDFFHLWNRQSFVLHHAVQFKDCYIKAVRLRLDVFKKEFVFLELIKIEKNGSSDDPVEGLWLKELIDNDLIDTFSTKDQKVAEQKNSVHGDIIIILRGKMLLFLHFIRFIQEY